jgi:uncharacterized protein (DUF2252 family)
MGVDVVREIRAFNAGRDPERLKLKYRAMAASPFAFLRGSCHLFYRRLPRDGVFATAPAVWVCGDLHIENFGSYRGDNRLTYFDVNDFDESALAPASWDLVRFLTSLHVGADTLSIGRAKVDRLCQRFVDAYAAALTQGKAYWVERDTSTGLVRDLFDELRDRDRAGFIAARTVVKGKKRVLKVDGQKALPVSDPQREAVVDFMRDYAKSRSDPGFFKVLDVARRIAGTGSLGVDRFVILIEGRGSPEGNYLLDLKRALPSSLLPRLKVRQPHWRCEGERAVTLQRRLQAIPMAFLEAVQLSDASYVLRSLQPSEDRVKLEKTQGDMALLEPLVGTMGQIVAWGQLRSAGQSSSAIADDLIAFGTRRKWKEQLLLAADAAAAQTHRDAAEFAEAFGDGEMG